jgi:hypothetical protein
MVYSKSVDLFPISDGKYFDAAGDVVAFKDCPVVAVPDTPSAAGAPKFPNIQVAHVWIESQLPKLLANRIGCPCWDGG